MSLLNLKNVRWIVLAALVAAIACSRGELSDNHDRYMNVFGLPLADSVPNKGAFLGRALLQDGAPAAWAQVDARQSGDTAQAHPLVTMTNEKGGFFLGNLEPGAYDVYVRSPAGQATRYQAQVNGGDVTVVEAITLLPTARVSGHATLASQPVHTGIVVNVPGTPFATFTDHEGAYYLDLPVGTYTLRADKDAYQPFETEPQEIGSDTTLDFALEENPWPNGKVTVISEDGFIVHGLTTLLKLEPVEGVRYFRISGGGVVVANDGTVAKRSWRALTEQVDVQVEGEGATAISVEFMDQYGKTSDPITTRFYNTLKDHSWQFVYGTFRSSVKFAPGSKLFFLGSGDYYGGSEDATIANQGFQLTGLNSADGSTIDPDDPGSQSSTVFLRDVTIQAGTEIEGSALFAGDLKVLGTKDHPVTWRGKKVGLYEYPRVTSLGGNSAFHYLNLSGATMATSGAINAVAFTDSTLTDISFYLRQRFYTGARVANELTINHSLLKGTNLEMACWHSQSGYDGSGGEGSGSGSGSGGGSGPDVFGGTMKLSVENSTLDHSPLALRCINFDPGYATAISYKHNNDLGLADGSFYVEGALPAATKLTYDVGENHFQVPGRLYAKFGTDGWPAFFGTKAEAPFTDATVR